jgi:hypothetical protein
MDIKLPIEKFNYGEYKSQNYGSHCQRIRVGDLTLFFSYDTVIAFVYDGHRYISENKWGSTTGKHLNWIDGHNLHRRLKREIFEKELQRALVDFKWIQVLWK